MSKLLKAFRHPRTNHRANLYNASKTDKFAATIHQAGHRLNPRIKLALFDGEDGLEFVFNCTQAGIDIGVIIQRCDESLEWRHTKFTGLYPWSDAKTLTTSISGWLRSIFPEYIDDAICKHLMPHLMRALNKAEANL